MIAGLTPPAPAPLGWRWFVADYRAQDGARYGLEIPAASWADAEAALAEFTSDGRVLGEMIGRIDG